MATHADEKLKLLAKSPFLSGLSRKDLEQVGRLADEVDVPAGRVVLREGEIGQEFFVIVEGGVDIERDGRRLRTMGPGEFFGDIALVTERPLSATVTTNADSQLLVVGHREFHELLDRFPAIRLSVLESIALRLRALEPDHVH